MIRQRKMSLFESKSWRSIRYSSVRKKNALAIYMSPSFFFDIKFCFTRLTIQSNYYIRTPACMRVLVAWWSHHLSGVRYKSMVPPA